MNRILLLVVFSFISWVSYAQPSTQASNITISPISGQTAQLKFDWTSGTGTNKVIVVIRDGTAQFTPANNTTYAANNDFGAGTDIKTGGTGIAKCVFNNTSSIGTVDVLGLTPGSEYILQIFEYTGAASAELYNRSQATNNPIVLRYYTAASTSWSKPTGVRFVTAQVWGGGGGGGGTNDADDGAGGGGGGAYSTGLVDVTGAGSFTVTVGQGVAGGAGDTEGTNGEDSWFGSAATVMAKGGRGGFRSDPAGGDGGPGGLAGSGFGSSKFDGGDGGKGRDNPNGRGGPGGSSAGTAANGTDGPTTWSTVTAAAPPSGGGKGGDGGLEDADGSAGSFPGGGGGGSGDNGGSGNQNGGNGAGGLVIVSFSQPNVLSATLNYGTGVLVVTCSENISAADPTKFHLNDATGVDNVNLTETPTGFGTNVLTFTLTEAHRLAALAISGVTGGNGGAVVLDVDAGGITSAQGNLNLIDDNNPVAETADTVLPVFSATAPTTGSFRNTTQVSYTLSETIASGTITWTRTSGTADGGSPHTQALTGGELTIGAHNNITLTNNPTLVHGSEYTVTFNGTDAAGNAATAVTATSVTYDFVAPVISATAPASSARVNNTQVSYTLSETVATGSITWTRTGGTADGGSPHVQALDGTELNIGAHNNITLTNDPTLVNGTIYTMTFDATDAAGNVATTVTNTNITFDTSPPVFSATAPTTGSYRNSTQVSYTLSENLASGSITWTRTSGTADGGSPHVQALTGTELNSGIHNNITLTNNPTLVNGTIYTVDFNGIDLATNVASTVTATNVTFDTSPPVISATAPSSSTFVNNTQVSYTLSEDASSGTITWTRTGGTADPGSPRIQALTGTELNSGAHNNITLTNNPALVSGTIYTMTFNVNDLAGNAATTITNTNITFDNTLPVFSATAPASSSFINNTQVSYTLSETIASGSITWTQTGGTADGGSPHMQALTGTELSAGPHTNITLTNNPTLVSGAIYSISFNGTDAAGNVASTVTATDVTFDNSPPVISGTAPPSSSSVATTQVSYTLSETVTSGSITWTRTGGTADPGSPHVQALSGTELNSGAHNNIILTNNPSLVNGTVYTMTYNATDAAGNMATTVTNTNITFETASFSSIRLDSSPVPISSLMNSSGASANVMQFTIFDDGQDPISPNVMTLHLNGVSQETVTFTLRAELTLGEGAFVSGFTSSTGAVVDARYSDKGGSNIITLTSNANGVWNSSTTISYNSATGNAEFVVPSGLGKMQTINAHAVVQVVDNIAQYNTPGSWVFNVPAGVTKVTIETWGAGGSGGAYNSCCNAGGGGGGGAYSRSLLTVTPGTPYNLTVGQGGFAVGAGNGIQGGYSEFGGFQVYAVGGQGGSFSGSTAGGSGGSFISGIGNVRFSGGNGGNGAVGGSFPFTFVPGGGGGSSAGNTTSGNPGNCCGGGGGIAPAGGGNGGNGFISGGQNGFFPGGGGGGTGDFSISGAGSNGRVLVTYSAPAGGGTSDWDADNAPFKFSELIITQGAGNSAALSNWQDIIAGAELFDGTNTVAGTINASNITFSSIPSSVNTDLGFIDDASGAISTKSYTLKVWLRNDLNNTLAGTVDGLNLAFQLDPSVPANLVYDNTSNGLLSSALVATHPALESGTNQIQVVASKLVYNTPGTAPTNTNPQAQIGVGIPFSANIAGQDPEVYALDANNNRDLGYNNTANISNPIQNFGQSISSASFVSGRLALNPFFFTTGSTTVQNTQIVVAGMGAPVVTPATSTNVASIISTLTTITAGPSAEPATISSLGTALGGAVFPQQNAIQNFDFTITDDVGADGTTFVDNDALPTRFTQLVIGQGAGNDPLLGTWTDAIASAQLSDGISTVTGTIGATTITFGPLSESLPGNFGYVPDGSSKTYRLTIALKTDLSNPNASLPDIIDNTDFVFSIVTGDITVNAGPSTTSIIQSAQAVDSGNGNNTVSVDATKLDFTTQWTALADQDYDAPLIPSTLQAKAHDANNNLDQDWSTGNGKSGTVQTAIPGTYPLNNSTVTLTNGVFDFDNAIAVSSSGNGADNALTNLVLSSTGLSNGISNTFRLNYSNASDIIKDVALTYPTNILYASGANQATDITASDGSTGTVLERFKVRDGGGSTDADGTDTKLSSITLRITNWQYLRKLALYDGTSTELGEVDVAASAFNITGTTPGSTADVTFSGITGFAAPDGPPREKSFEVVASFKAGGIADNEVVSFQVMAVAAQGASSQFANPAPAGIVSTVTGDQNKIEVVATQIIFTAPANASISTDLTPQVTVAARDAFSNLDSDYNGTITATDNTDNTNFTTINDPTGAFSGGLKSYPTNFQFTAGDGTVQLTINAGPGSGGGVNAGAISGISNTISVLSSYESTLSSIATPQDIDYVNFQATNITGSSDGYILDVMQLADGGIDLSDLDGAPTVLDDLTIGISNPMAIRKIAIYSQNPDTPLVLNEIDEQANGAITVVNGYGTITFTNLNISAPDNDDINVLVLATFDNTVANITDGDFVQVVVLGATLNTGSKFAPDAAQTGSIGGIQTSINSPFTLPEATASVTVGSVGPLKRMQVVATSLDFTTQASAFAGTNEPVGPSYAAPGLPTTSAAIVEARDENAILDIDFNPTAASITIIDNEGENIPSPAGFINGILNLDGLIYTLAGDGTLSVQASGIDSANPPPANTSAIPGQLVNVINVTATQATNGVLTTTNIKGGSVNQVIFGVTFTPDNNSQTTTEPSLSKFIFTFDKPYEYPGGPVFKNFDVRESTSATFAGSTTVTLTGATITKGNSGTNPGEFDQVIVDWGLNPPRPLYDGSGNPAPKSYFLVADADATASISTPALTPALIDAGFGSPKDDNIITTQGTAVAQGGAVVGQTYQFASTRPPVLLAAQSNPFSGQLNVDPATTSIFLRFDVEVISLDGKAELFNRDTNTKVADLIANPANTYNPIPTPLVFTNTANPIEFTIDFLPGFSFEADNVYYVTIKKGTFDNAANNGDGAGEGISDSGLNYYGGISSNGTYYFKISSQNPPNLINASLTSPPFINQKIGTFTTEFDQQGTAYYLILTSGSPAPSVSEIETGVYSIPANKRAGGSYTINQINTDQTVTFAATPQLNTSTTYDIWIFAKNNALPTPVPAANPYGGIGASFAIGGAGPTLSFTVPASPPNSYTPNYSLCPDSFVNLSAPIILGESSPGAWSSASPQDFYILLPTGYVFDTSHPTNFLPTVQLIGNDFGGSANVSFINSTLVHVTFNNNGATSNDILIIKDLRIRGISDSNPGSIRKFAGTNMLGSNPVLANISLFPADDQKFINSFAQDNPFVALTASGSLEVAAIPDNYIDLDPQISGSVRLLPQIQAANDYGASFFTGTGVTDDKLTLSAVALNSAFDINMFHTDPNGCLSETSVQYLVYDHRSPISPELGSSYLPPSPLAGTQQAIDNPNFNPNVASPASGAVFTYGPLSPSGPNRINVNDLAGYRLIQLDADLPFNDNAQIMNDNVPTEDWKTVVNSIPEEVHSIPTTDIPSTAVNNNAYREYQWDYSRILNAKYDNHITIDPYDNFRKTTTHPTLGTYTYWEGGSLGKVEFTGLFQSTADFTVVIPFRQNVEIFLPAIPVILIGSNNQSASDLNDQTTNTLSGNTPEVHLKLFQYPGGINPGTAVFCEAGGPIILNGFPAATAGVSTGTFAFYDFKSFDFTTGTGTLLSGFIDNGNGTAQVDPTNVGAQNNYDDILVSYTFKNNNSPAVGTGYFVIRITPNPVAQFSAASVLGSGASSSFDAFCSSNAISFDAAPSIITLPSQAGSTNTIDIFEWDFGDPNSGTANTATTSVATHTYSISSTYPVNLQLTSNWGCKSLSAATLSPDNTTLASKVFYPGSNGLVRVGDIPTVNFSFVGNCVGDAITFTDISSTPPSSNSYPANYVWDFDYPNGTITSGNDPVNTANSLPTTFVNFPASPDGTLVSHTYVAAQNYQVSLTTTTNLGCSSTTIKTLAQLPLKTPTQAADFSEFFDASDGGWLALDLSGPTPTAGGSSSWVWNDPVAPGKWTTKAYNPAEESALYSACLDLSTIPRPVISFNANIGLSTGEGLVMQYSKDNLNIFDPAKEWEVLGTTSNATVDPSPGLDWYNDIGLPSNPGTGYVNSKNANGYGWTQNLGNIEPKHKLEDVDENNPLPNDRVILRLAFAALGASGQGVTIDSIRVGSRTRTVLLENFTTTDGGTNAVLNSQLASEASDISAFITENISSTQVVNINYHIGFIGDDPFNKDNPADPSSRALFYNVSKVPFAFLDGIHSTLNGSDLFQDWGEGAYDLQTLQLANANFKPAAPLPSDITTVVNNSDGSMAIDVIVKPTRDLPSSTKLFIAVLEEVVLDSQLPGTPRITTGETQFNYVLKKLIPNGVGTRYPAGTFQRDVTVHLGPNGTVNTADKFSWIPSKLYTNQLSVVLFLQDSAKEVYQSEFIQNLSPPAPVTGLDLVNFADRIGIYPNPADAEVKILLPAPAPREIQVQMIDQMGRVVNQATIQEGKDGTEIDSRDMAAGIYMVLFGSGDTSVFKKVMIVHRN